MTGVGCELSDLRVVIALLVGPILYFTPYWQPLLYLLGVGFAIYLGGLWMLVGMEYFAFGVIAGITATSFILLGLYLFYREETQDVGDVTRMTLVCQAGKVVDAVIPIPDCELNQSA